MEQIGTFLNKRSTLSEREVEMVIVMIATHWRGDYVQTAHVRMGRKVGLSQAIIDALIAGAEPPLTDPHEKAVYQFAAAMIASRKVPDAEFAAIEKTLGRPGIAEVLVLIGYYTSVAMAMKVHEVPIPPSFEATAPSPAISTRRGYRWRPSSRLAFFRCLLFAGYCRGGRTGSWNGFRHELIDPGLDIGVGANLIALSAG